MAVEIERKFLVDKNVWNPKEVGEVIAQGYLQHDKEKTVRVRLKGEKAYLTVKGETEGISRLEFEYEIPVSDAEEMLELCGSGVISKVRYEIAHKGFVWEVDEFFGENKGLLLAEVELSSVRECPDLPSWVLEEVSGDKKYYNSYLSEHPFNSWDK